MTDAIPDETTILKFRHMIERHTLSEAILFEGRGPRCTLIVFIDDATSELMALRFAPAETTQAYMETLRAYLAQHGRAVALYSDKHSIFRVNHPDHGGELTQFTRALRTLDIKPIHANTPQAKGRVERANQTLQDRLVKELRLAGISGIDAANAFLPGFLSDYNLRFAAPSELLRRASSRAARSTRTQLDLQPAYSAQALEEPHLPVQKPGVSAHGTGQELSPLRCPGHRLRGLRRLCDRALQGASVVLPYPRRRRTAHPLG